MTSSASPRILIVGGVAAGMSAATRARRLNEHAEITIIERGGFVSFANCGLPYHIAGRIAHEEKLLVVTPERLRQRFNLDVRLHTEAVRIDRASRTLVVRNLQQPGAPEESLPYDKLILAPGASPIVPPLAGLKAPNVFTVRSIEDTRAVQSYLASASPRTAVVVGAGFIGLEMAEALHDRGLVVTLVEKAPHVLPPLDAELSMDLEHELAAHHIPAITGCGLSDVQARSGAPLAVSLEDGRTLEADLLVLSIGVKPNVELARQAGLSLGPTGAIAVNGHQQTSDPDIYAAGDAAEVLHAVTGRAARIPLAGPANRHGRIAGEHAALSACAQNPAEVRPTRGVAGTAIVQVFTLEAGVTGLSESAARAAGFDVDTAYTTSNNHAGYYPGATAIRMKLVYDRRTGRVLGAQAIGHSGVDKRLDVVATVLHFQGTIDDLADLDLAYAPQFGSAKDPVHIAAFVAQNQREGITPAVVPSAVGQRQLVDVRTVDEFARGHEVQAINIPLDSLRQRTAELDPAKPTAVMCQAGLRGHVAVRMLKQRGFSDVVNVKGGWDLARRKV